MPSTDHHPLSSLLYGPATLPHLEDAVRLHRAQLPGGFMSSLGDAFLLKVFRNIAQSPHGVAIVAVIGDQVAGFILGTVNAGGLYRDFIRRYAMAAVLDVLPRAFRLATALKVFETLFYPSKRHQLPGLPRAELLDIAVSDSCKGSGLAQRMFREFAAELGQRGSPEFRITTGGGLTRAHRFYERLGATRVGSIAIHQGEETVVYVWRPRSQQG